MAAQSCDKSEAYITHFHQNYCFHFGAITVETIEIAPTFINRGPQLSLFVALIYLMNSINFIAS